VLLGRGTPDATGNTMKEGTVIREDILECLSKSRESFRLVLTTNQVIVQDSKNHSRIERYPLDDLFGCHTLRHKKSGGVAAYLCFYLYPRTKKKGLMNHIKFREKVTLVFEIKKPGNSYEHNLDLATQWKQSTLETLGKRYPKWQLHRAGVRGETQDNNANEDINNILPISSLALESQDAMDHIIHEGESTFSLASYLLYVRRFLVILNPKSGQGKTMEMFQVSYIKIRVSLIIVYSVMTKAFSVSLCF
jgi:hypothetical protein